MSRTLKEVKRVEPQPEIETSEDFTVEYDQDENTASFYLLNGTHVKLKSPKAKQFLLLNSWVEATEAEMKSDILAALKLAQLCIVEYGNQTKVSFDNLLDQLEIKDIERLANALSCFRDIFESLPKPDNI